MKRYDAIVVGGGHNGLVAATYLARAGFDVCILERHHTVGGAAYSDEIAPGFLVSMASYVLSLAPRKILDDMQVWQRGLEMIPRNPRSFVPFLDGTYMATWEDESSRPAELAKFSKHDADAWPAYDAFVERACEVMDRFILRPPPSWGEFAAEFQGPRDAAIFQKLILGSSADIAEYFFEDEHIQASVASSGVIGTFRGPREAGTGYVKLYHSMGMATGTRGMWAYVRGGMGSVARAFESAAREAGVTIRTGCEVQQVRIRDGRATGVVLADGEEVEGRTVFSNADPKRTYLKLVERSELPPEYVRDVEAIKIDSPVLKINLALAEPPRFKCLEGKDDELSRRLISAISIAPSIDTMQRGCEEARAGRPSDYPWMSIHMQSAVDPTVAPPGKHTLSIFTQFFPYHLAEGAWETRRDEIADHVLRRLGEYAPNLPGAVLARQVLGPPDLEARFGLTGGHIFHGELVPEQAFDLRPVPGSRTYEGPIQGLYLCGSGAWPGGCVMGAPGHNAAHEAIANLRAGRHAS
jgi:phytoene dehydrogenase-like protein